MNNEDIAQITSMMDWSQKQSDVVSMSMKTYKRFNEQDQHYSNMYLIEMHKWTGQKHVILKGESDTVLGAMTQLVGKM